MRCIDADALDKQLQKDEELARKRVLDTESCLPYPNNLNPSYTRYVAQMDERTRLKHMVADAPTIEPERKKGKWIRWHETKEDETGTEYIPHCRCSECGTEYDPHSSKFVSFCNVCGAKMEEGGTGMSKLDQDREDLIRLIISICDYARLGYDVSTHNNCNNCADKECIYKPKLGRSVRWNCPLWKEGV